MDDHDDNIFDEDDALDYIMYEEVEKEVNDPQTVTNVERTLLETQNPSPNHQQDQ
jgi:hypothetical protein